MNINKIPKFKILLLVGAGHANIQVLKHLSMHDYDGIQTILINDGFTTLYSGMTPGLIEGYYDLEESSIDLPKLCQNSNTIFINDRIIKLDTFNKSVSLGGHPDINYNLLSLNTGSDSKISDINIEDTASSVSLKPISNLLSQVSKIDNLVARKKSIICSIIGGGIAGIETALSLNKRFKGKVKLKIFERSKKREKKINYYSIKKLKKILYEQHIEIVYKKVIAIKKNYLLLEDQEQHPSDINIISTGAMGNKWVIKSGLKLDKDNFVKVNKYLQAEDNPNVFATGDMASLNFIKRPKSGVMAVRQGEILKKNIFRLLLNKKLVSFSPQSNWLYLIGTGNKKAVLNWYFISLYGSLFWKWKENIDRKFINNYSFNETIMIDKKNCKTPLTRKLNLQKKNLMRCEGCGSKLSKNILIKFLEKNSRNNSVILSDAAELELPNQKIVQSIDHIKYFSNMDPYVFGRISYLHSQNDIISSGSFVNSFSVSIGLPADEEEVSAFYLEYFMKGILEESKFDNSVLASGHTYSSEESGITINMNGYSKKLNSKNKAHRFELIYLTKPLGVGLSMAAFMQNSKNIKAETYSKILENMLASNRRFLEVVERVKGHILTDISGFGLAAHLIDICKSSELSAVLKINKDILINGTEILVSNYFSSAYNDNKISSESYVATNNNKLVPVLYDPQTSGPLLVSIAKEQQINFEKDFRKINGTSPILIGHFESKKEYLIRVI